MNVAGNIVSLEDLTNDGKSCFFVASDVEYYCRYETS
jgi:hypothetical protein